MVEVLPGSPAERAGVRAASFRGADIELGDLITHVAGNSVKQVHYHTTLLYSTLLYNILLYSRPCRQLPRRRHTAWDAAAM